MDELVACDDWGLLRRYALAGEQAAFAEIVARHAGLVYAVAKRITGSASVAEEVAQSVFVDLARVAVGAKGYDEAVPVVAWLCTVARRTAIDALRKDTRRQAREKTAQEILEADMSMNKFSAGDVRGAGAVDESAWAEAEPLLGEALEELGAKDRAALLLRFWENKNLREIGAALGASEDAAQKRVTRALEQLRDLLGKRGVKLTAAGLATGLTAQAATLGVAPVGLATTISAAVGGLGWSAAGGGAGGTAAVATSGGAKAFAITGAQKIFLGGAAALALALGLNEWLGWRSHAAKLDAARSALAQVETEASRLTALKDERRRELAAFKAEVDRRVPAAGSDEAVELELIAWLDRAEQLKQVFRDHPEWAIPEMEALMEEDWFKAVTSSVALEGKSRRSILAQVRGQAVSRIAEKIRPALKAFEEAHPGEQPDALVELLPYLKEPLSRAILERYEFLKSDEETYKTLGLRVAQRAFVDIECDQLMQFGVDWTGWGLAIDENISHAQKAYRAAHGDNAGAEKAEQLLPLLKWPMELSTLEKRLKAPKVQGLKNLKGNQ